MKLQAPIKAQLVNANKLSDGYTLLSKKKRRWLSCQRPSQDFTRSHYVRAYATRLGWKFEVFGINATSHAAACNVNKGAGEEEHLKALVTIATS